VQPCLHSEELSGVTERQTDVASQPTTSAYKCNNHGALPLQKLHSCDIATECVLIFNCSVSVIVHKGQA